MELAELVRVSLRTKKIKGLHANDFILAARIDQAFVRANMTESFALIVSMNSLRRWIMPIAPTLMRYLDQNVTYEILFHEPTMSSMRTAEASHVSGDCLAKAVVLRRGDSYLLAVLPASHRISLPELRMKLGGDVDVASESNVDGLFRDCAHGAIPPVGECYGLDVIVDEAIDQQPEIYFEGGDHTTLIHMSQPQFARLTAKARHERFSFHY